MAFFGFVKEAFNAVVTALANSLKPDPVLAVPRQFQIAAQLQTLLAAQPNGRALIVNAQYRFTSLSVTPVVSVELFSQQMQQMVHDKQPPSRVFFEVVSGPVFDFNDNLYYFLVHGTPMERLLLPLLLQATPDHTGLVGYSPTFLAMAIPDLLIVQDSVMWILYKLFQAGAHIERGNGAKTPVVESGERFMFRLILNGLQFPEEKGRYDFDWAWADDMEDLAAYLMYILRELHAAGVPF